MTNFVASACRIGVRRAWGECGLGLVVAWGYAADVKPLDLQPIGKELAIKWDDGGESFVTLERLRRACPCASCQGEVDVMGQLHKGPDRALSPAAFIWRSSVAVGGYGIQPTWGDGHSSGIFTFDLLRKLVA